VWWSEELVVAVAAAAIVMEGKEKILNITLQGFSTWANGLANLVFSLSLNKYIFLGFVF